MKNRFLLAAAMLSLPLLCLNSCRMFKYHGDNSLEGVTLDWDADTDWESEGAMDTIVVDGDVVSSDGDWVTRDIPVGEFNSLEVDMAADITYRVGDCALTVTTSENVLDNLNASVDGGKLVLAAKPGVKFRNIRKFQVVLSAPSLESIYIDGAANFRVKDDMTVKDFTLVVSGAGDFDLGRLKSRSVNLQMDGLGDIEVSDIDCSDLKLSLNGMGSIKVSGKAGSADASISGMGSIDMSDLRSDDITNSVEGLGNIKMPKQGR